MKTILATVMAATLSASVSAATASTARESAPSVAPPAEGSVFDELAALGYDLEKFRPPYLGRFPYR
jgi:hypothetical protein